MRQKVLSKYFYLSLASLLAFQTQAQVDSPDKLEQEFLNWYNLDPEKDHVPGTGADRVYSEILPNHSAKKTIIVAVIDSGVDVDHEDLEGKIWVNEREVANNGVDDDGNGYIDDIYGWNFIGNKKGENVELETYEYTRVYKKYNSKFKKLSEQVELSPDEKQSYKVYEKGKALYEKNLNKHLKEKDGITRFEEIFKTTKEIIDEELGYVPATIVELKAVKTESWRAEKAIDFLIERHKMGFTEEKLAKYKTHNEECLNVHLNVDINPREIIGDNPFDIKDVDYGNNNVVGPRANHGTSVAGVIAANRNNEVGINGIAENVKIMVLRAVPKGDEYDKDIALAIRYAADNGANIINMSFGKEISPNKEFVDEAVKYAESKNILMVHASGNNGADVDEHPRFPNDKLYGTEEVISWLEVGANTKYFNSELPADFSNYGRKTVDIFAPGADVISLDPDNKYDINDGTSLASPIVSGVAALVWSHYPDLSARELKEVLLNSVTKVKRPKVITPSDDSAKPSKTKFAHLSSSGGIVNAYQAMKLAESLSN